MSEEEPSSASASVSALRSRFEAFQAAAPRPAKPQPQPQPQRPTAGAAGSGSSSASVQPSREPSPKPSVSTTTTSNEADDAQLAPAVGAASAETRAALLSKKQPPPKPPVSPAKPRIVSAPPPKQDAPEAQPGPDPILPDAAKSNTPPKKRPPPPPPSLSTKPAISVSNTPEPTPLTAPPLPASATKPRSRSLTPSMDAAVAADGERLTPSKTHWSSFPLASSPAGSSSSVDSHASAPARPAPPVLPPRSSTLDYSRSAPGSRPHSPSAELHAGSTDYFASAQSASAEHLPQRRPPPPIPARGFSIPAAPNATAPTHGKAPPPPLPTSTRPHRSASETPLPDLTRLQSAPVHPPGPFPLQSQPSESVPAVTLQRNTSSVRPPPSRNVALGEKVAPVRPAAAAAAAAAQPPGIDGSSDEGGEDAQVQATKGDATPDASVASRRPPAFDASGSHVRFHTTSKFTCAVLRGRQLVIGSAHHVRVYDLQTKDTLVSVPVSAEAHKVTALNFRTDISGQASESIIWAGTKDGNLAEVDLASGTITSARSNIHPGAVVRVDQVAGGMVTLGEGGRLMFWKNDEQEGCPILSFQASETRRLTDDAPFNAMMGELLWTSSGPHSKSELKTPAIRVYKPDANPSFDLTLRPLLVPETGSVAAPSAVLCSTTLPSDPGLVFLGHESGHITVWRSDSLSFVSSLRVAAGSVTALAGVDRYIWCGFKSGKIHVLDTHANPWQLIIAFKAHSDAVAKLLVNFDMLWVDGTLPVVSLSQDGEVCVWDGLLSQWYLDKHMTIREPDYSTYREASCLVCSWNVDAAKPSALDESPVNHNFLQDCLSTGQCPDIIVFSFQELIDLENKTLAAKSFIFGRKKGEKGMMEQVSHHYHLWRDRLAQAIRVAMPADCPYSLVHAEVLVGLFTCIFVKDSEKPNLRDLNISQVKTGLAGRFGNKGSIVARMVLDDTSICFSNCHLAAGQSHVRQRNKDLVDILESADALPAVADFAPNAYIGGGDGSMVFDHNIVILSGDLNYRIDLRRDFVVQQSEAGRFEPLWEHDQLIKQLKNNPQHRLRSFKEEKLAFAPTYKYDRGSDRFDSSEKARCPAYCDRILWRTIETANEAAAQTRQTEVTVQDFRRYEVNVSDHRPISAVLRLPIRREDSSVRKDVFQIVQQQWEGEKQKLVEQSQQFYLTSA